jgi:hypothetical protein
LDPSAGAGVFLQQAANLRQASGQGKAIDELFGVDIDEIATHRTRQLLALHGVPKQNIVAGDFMALKFERTFDAVVGNPPYVRANRVSSQVKAVSRMRRTMAGNADLWAHFVTRSTKLVGPEGRMVFVLPRALTQADYAEAVLTEVAEAFGFVAVASINQRLFNGTDEASVVLLAANRGGCTSRIRFEAFGSADDLIEFLSDEQGSTQPFKSEVTSLNSRIAGSEASEVFSSVVASDDIRTLGVLGDVRIGVVTGANAFFVRPPGKLVDDHSVPIVSTSAWLRSPRWTEADQTAKRSQGERTQLLTLPDRARSFKYWREEIARGENLKLSERVHCKKRPKWWQVPDTRIPDAFLPYMGALPAPIVANRAGVTCTNSTHRLYWTCGKDRSEKALVSTWSTLFEFTAEFLGRSYGGGVLKLEPSAAKLVPIAVSATLPTVAAIDMLARQAGRASAIAAVDAAMIESGVLTLDQLTVLREATRSLRKVRRGEAFTSDRGAAQ